MSAFKTLAVLSLWAVASAKNIVLTNDDGWAVAQIRAQFGALETAGYSVVLSSPAQDNSGTGSLSFPPLPLLTSCEYDSCPAGSPAEGFNASDSRLNYVNSFPVDAAKYGIQTLSPKFFGGPPDLVVSGPNVGYNTGIEVEFSGTVGAACEAVQNGIPAIAISGTSTAEEAWTNLVDTPTSASILATHEYATLTNKVVAALFAQAPTSPSILSTDVILNINYPALSATCTADSVQFVFSRVYWTLLPLDVHTCNNGGALPDEASVVAAGCFASVSVVDAWLKTDVTASTQQDVLNRLSPLGLVCLP